MTTGANSDTRNSEDTTAANELPLELINMFESLAGNEKIVFKSQQIDDPELNASEKQQIAQDLFNKNRESFLLRFGYYLTDSQLCEFQALAVVEPFKPEENAEEMCLLLDDLKRKLHTRSICVKNRRYAAMNQLLDKGEYFSEHEMMQRAPELYEELVGQFLSDEEKKQRDSYDVRNTSFSGILMHTLEQKQRDELLDQADVSLKAIEAAPANASPDFEVPVECRKQWGGFDDDAPVACSTSRALATITAKRPTTAANFYNPGERELLRHEFMGIMKERFLSGEDKDFNYTAVDENTLLDDLKQIEQDEEDAYFESTDDEEAHEAVEIKSVSRSSESEDELEIYMRHLNNHHSLQQH